MFVIFFKAKHVFVPVLFLYSDYITVWGLLRLFYKMNGLLRAVLHTKCFTHRKYCDDSENAIKFNL